MKYIIDMPDDAEWIEVYKSKHSSNSVKCFDGYSVLVHTLTPYTEPDRKAIEDEVWEFVDFIIWEMDVEDRDGCFDRKLHSHVFHDYTYQEAKSKYEEWLKQKDEIKVGDEVYITNPNVKDIVTKVKKNGFAYLLCDDGEYHVMEIDSLIKTGRHFPEVAELLEKMREEEE